MRCHNPFEGDGIWLKANLHTHTTNSDGDQTPQARVEHYARQGYDVLALTDHRSVTPIESLGVDGMVLIQSLESHPACPGGPVYHLVCLDVPADFDCDEGVPANEVVARVREHGGEVIAAHPYWCGHTIPQILALDGIIGIEVYNATCGKIGKADSSMFWDYLLAAGRHLPAVAVDDTHRGRDIFMGWTMIRAEKRTVPAVMKALKQGRYYATTGPLIQDFRACAECLSIRCSPVREIHFKCRGAVGRSVYSEQGDVLTAAEFSPPASAAYVRVQITDAHGQSAWTQPLIL